MTSSCSPLVSAPPLLPNESILFYVNTRWKRSRSSRNNEPLTPVGVGSASPPGSNETGSVCKRSLSSSTSQLPSLAKLENAALMSAAACVSPTLPEMRKPNESDGTTQIATDSAIKKRVRSKKRHSKKRPSVDPEGTLYLTDFRILWVPRIESETNSSPVSKEEPVGCCECVATGPQPGSPRNGMTSIPYLTIEDVAFLDEDGEDVSALVNESESNKNASAKPGRAVNIKIETKCFIHAEFRFAPTPSDVQEGAIEAWRVVARIILEFALEGVSQSRSFAFKFRPHAKCMQSASVPLGWKLFDDNDEWNRLQFSSSKWRRSEVNSQSHVCVGYPKSLIVPAAVGDDSLLHCASLHAGGRFPTVVWRSVANGAVIARSSPHIGTAADESNVQEIELLSQIRVTAGGGEDARLSIIDARSISVGEDSGTSECIELESLSLEDMHELRESKNKLRRVILSKSVGNGRHCPKIAASDLSSTGWIDNLIKILDASSKAATLLSEGVSILFICSSGFDQSAQLSALTQLIIDPFYRTLKGFFILVEKEWLQYGHCFARRHGHGHLEDSECSPMFLVFVDCVHQILNQFPEKFEFTDMFLCDLVRESYGCRTGTFFSNDIQQRATLDLSMNTASFWSIASAAAPKRYLNPSYSADGAGRLNVRCDSKGISLWKEFYLQHSPVVADNVAFDRQLLAKMPETVNSAITKAENKQLSPVSRHRSISSSSAVKRAVVVVPFVAENDSSSLALMKGQEVLLLEKTSEETWFIAIDHKRSFMARVPAKNLMEIDTKGIDVRRRRTSRTVRVITDRRISPLSSNSSVPVESPPPSTRRSGAPPKPVFSPQPKEDVWKTPTTTRTTGARPRSHRTSPEEKERFLQQLQQQQHLLQQPIAAEEPKKFSGSWEDMKREYMSANRLSPMNERISRKHARIPPQPWFSDHVSLVASPLKSSPLSVTVPPSQLLSSLLSPRATSHKRQISLSLDEGENPAFLAALNGPSTIAATVTPRRPKPAVVRTTSSNQLNDRRGMRTPKLASPFSPGSPHGMMLSSPVSPGPKDTDDDSSDDESGDDISLSDSSDDEDGPSNTSSFNPVSSIKRSMSSFFSGTDKSLAGNTASMFSPRPQKSSSMRNLLNLFRSSSSSSPKHPGFSSVVPVVHGIVPAKK